MPLQQDLLAGAIGIARHAREHGNHSFGALLADEAGNVVLSAENTVVTESDATGHAETNLVRLASGRFSSVELAELTLYSSAERRAMCSGAIYWSGIGGVVYAMAKTELYELTGNDPQNPTLVLPCRTVFAAGQREVLVQGPFEIDGAREVHAGFWRT